MLGAGVSIALLGMAVVFVFLFLLVLVIHLSSHLLKARTTAELTAITAESRRKAARRAAASDDRSRLVAVVSGALAMHRKLYGTP